MQAGFRTRFAWLGALALSMGTLGACVENQSQARYPDGQANGQGSGFEAPPSQQMQEPRALGLWKSNFGAVKIEEDLTHGQPGAGVLQGVWMYKRGGQDVIGYFAGKLDGNVLQFTWNEPPAAGAAAPLAGSGYVVFDVQGQRFRGRWWTDGKDRVGEWTGWRQGLDKPSFQNDPYGRPYQQPYGQPDGQQPYGQQPYNQPYPPQNGLQRQPLPPSPTGGYGGYGYGQGSDDDAPPPPRSY